MENIFFNIDKQLSISLVIIHYGDVNLLFNLFKSLIEHPDFKLIKEVIIINNGNDNIENELKCFIHNYSINSNVRIVNNHKTSYSSGVNIGASIASGEYIIISNNDIELIPSYSIMPLFYKLVNYPSVCAVGPQLVYPRNKWQRSYGRFPNIKSILFSIMLLDWIEQVFEKRTFKLNKQKTKSVEYIEGAFMVVKKKCFSELNGFDENFIFYGEDADFCIRAKRLRWKILFEPETRIIHLRGASSSKKDGPKYLNHLINANIMFIKKHYGTLHSIIYKILFNLDIYEKRFIKLLINKFKNKLPFYYE